MILWLRLLLGCLIAPATNVSTAVESATPEEDGDPMPICTRNRGPPPAGRPGYRTARSADNGTCPIHLRPVPSRSDPGCRSPEHQQRTTPHASPSDSRRSDQPTETPDRVEQPQATPAPGRFQPERVAGLNRNGWPNSPECTPDLIGRDFSPGAPNTRYCGDITYVPTAGAGSTWPPSSISGAGGSAAGRWPARRSGSR